MIHFNLLLHLNMSMKCAEDPFNIGMFFLPNNGYIFRTPERGFHTGVAAVAEGIKGQAHDVKLEERS